MEQANLNAECGNLTGSSTNTSLSGLTGYEEEFNDLRKLTKPNIFTKQYNVIPPNQIETSGIQFKAKTTGVTVQLENLLKENEKLKNELYAARKEKHSDLQEKMKLLISRNAELEAHLSVACNQMNAVLQQCRSPEISKLSGNALNLCEQIKYVQGEILRCNTEKTTNELLIKNIKSDLEAAKDEIATRVACVNELKRKVSEQYQKIEGIIEYNKKLESKLQSTQSELEWCRKSENWYKEQLHSVQLEKLKTSEDNISLQQKVFEKEQETERFSISINKLKHSHEEIQISFIKEKEALMQKIEALQFETVQKVVFNNTSDDTECTACKDKGMAIADMTQEIVALKKEVNAQTQLTEATRKQNSDLHARLIVLQKQLNEKEAEVEKLKMQKFDLQNHLQAKRNLEQEESKEILDLKTVNQKLEIQVSALSQEKQAIENAVATVRTDFSKIMAGYSKLKREVDEKDKAIMELESEKQKLFMDNNWKICDIENLNLKLESLRKKIANLEVHETKLNETNEELLKKIKIKESDIHNLRSAFKFLEASILEKEQKYKDTIKEKEKTLTDTQNNLSEAQEKITSLTNLLGAEKMQLHDCRENIAHLTSLLEEKSKMVQTLTLEISNMKAKQEKPKEQFSCEEMKDVEISQNIEHVLELIDDRLRKVKLNQLCKEDVNIEMKLFNDNTKCSLLLRSIMSTLFSIQLAKTKQTNLKNNLLGKLHPLLEKCNRIEKQTDDMFHLLNTLQQEINIQSSLIENTGSEECIVQLKAQELSLKEKIKRYEINNHTLLRKLKEHLKARNLAEKQNSQLRELHTSLEEAYILTKSEMNSKQSELDQLKAVNENLKAYNEKLQGALSDLEKQIAELQLERDIYEKSVGEKENFVEKLQNALSIKNAEVKDKKDLLMNLINEVIVLSSARLFLYYM